MKWLALFFWAVEAVAIYMYEHGDEGAATAVIGCGICAVIVTVLAAIESD